MPSNYAYTPSIWPTFFALLCLLALLTYSWRRSSVPGALPFAISCLLAVPMAVGIIMTYLAANTENKIFWARFESAWWLPSMTAVTCFILEYAWPGRWLTRRNLALLSITPLLSLLAGLTNDFHHLSFTSFNVGESVTPVYGPLGRVLIVYAFALALINLIVFAWLFVRSPQHRWPVALMATGQIVIRLMVLFESPQLDALLLNIPQFVLPFMAYAIALFGFHIFDPIPLANQMVIEQLQDGILVLDPQGRVAILNPVAEDILGITSRHAQGRVIRELLPIYQNGQLSGADKTVTEFTTGTEPSARDYTLRISPIKDWRGLEIGRLLLLRDVTEPKRAREAQRQQQLLVAVVKEREHLARELHDSLGQVFAFVNAQGQTVRRLLDRGDITKADEYVARMVEVAREADVDIREAILGLRVTLSEQGFFPALGQYLERYERNYEIHTELSKPEALDDAIFEPQVEVELLRILQEALTNARKHADAQRVQITFDVQDNYARITIQDDGQGFDSNQLTGGGIGERVGLRVMRERAEEVGGGFAIQSRPGEGTQIILTIPMHQGVLVKKIIPDLEKETDICAYS